MKRIEASGTHVQTHLPEISGPADVKLLLKEKIKKNSILGLFKCCRNKFSDDLRSRNGTAQRPRPAQMIRIRLEAWKWKEEKSILVCD